MPVDLDLALDTDPRALHLPIVASRRLALPEAIRWKGQSTRVWVVKRRVEGLLAARLTGLASDSSLIIVVHLLNALRVHHKAIDNHIGRWRFGRLTHSGELE